MLNKFLTTIKKGLRINLESDEVKNIKLPEVPYKEYSDDLLLDIGKFSQLILSSSESELLSIYQYFREVDEFWERVETSKQEFNYIALEILRLVSVVYELNINSGLAYTSQLYLQGELNITLRELTTAIENNISQKDIVRVFLEIYTINRSLYSPFTTRSRNAGIRALAQLEPPEIVYKKLFC